MPRKHAKRNGVSRGYIPKTLFIVQLLTLLLLASSVQVNASIPTKFHQAIDVKGKVIDKDRIAIRGVTVNIKGTKKSAMTNTRAFFFYTIL